MAIELDNVAAVIQHINARKIGDEHAKVLACDLKIEIDVEAGDVLPYFDATLGNFLFTETGVRYPAMGEIGWDGEMGDMEMDLAGFSFRSVRLSKFKIAPKWEMPKRRDDKQMEFDETEIDPRRVVLTFTASFQPQSTEFATIAELLAEQATISVRAMNQELPL